MGAESGQWVIDINEDGEKPNLVHIGDMVRDGFVEGPVAAPPLDPADFNMVFDQIDPDKLTDNQKLFIKDAEEDNFEVYEYTGRSMYGIYCPAVNVDDPSDLTTRAKTKVDNLGKGYVVYCP